MRFSGHLGWSLGDFVISLLSFTIAMVLWG
jgi:hypothetical protein